MPQPHTPAPHAQRPEPGIQLLEAVRQRQAELSLQLAQQWVHRRGVVDLQRFCTTTLDSAEGAEAVAWLQQLLGFETPSASNSTPPLMPPGSVCADPQAVPVLAVAESAGTPAEPIAATPLPTTADLQEPVQASGAAPSLQERQHLESELQARAVAAVDEAFAALAKTFQAEVSLAPAPTDPLPGPLSFTIEPAAFGAAAAKTAEPPRPMPVRLGLWPSLRASAVSLGAALRPAAGGATGQPAGPVGQAEPAVIAEPEPTLETLAAPEAQPAPSEPLQAAAETIQPDSPDAAEAPAGSLPGGEEAEAGSSPAVPAATQSDTESDVAEAPEGAAEATAAAAAESGARADLLQRLRGRLQPRRLPRLTRLRAVMRDCFEETVALLRTPEPDLNEDDTFEAMLPLEPPPVLTRSSPSWPLDSDLPARAGTGTGSAMAAARAEVALAPTAAAAELAASIPLPQAEAAPTGRAGGKPSVTAAAAAEMPLPVAPSISPLRPAPTASKPARVSERPAPAPAALSDLRAWLPDRADLPRAS